MDDGKNLLTETLCLDEEKWQCSATLTTRSSHQAWIKSLFSIWRSRCCHSYRVHKHPKEKTI